jgi:FKBP-type peptidyl-prolyl cis-trans isomerase
MRLRLLAVVAASGWMVAAHAQDVATDKGKLSYSYGYELGRTISEYGVDIDTATLMRAIQDGIARRNPAMSQQQMDQTMQALKQRLYARAKSAFDRAAAENQVSSESFLAKNRARPGVKVLSNGIQYRVVEEGGGQQVKPDDALLIQYRASLSTGKEFGSSYGTSGAQGRPVYVSIKDSPIAGIRQVLPMMREGARWEILLPSEQAYGSNPGSPVGPNQAVMFDIKIVDVNPTSNPSEPPRARSQ